MKFLVIVMVIFLAGCSKKTTSFEYYKSHIKEAYQKVAECKNSQDEDAQSCTNAGMAVEKDIEKKQEQQIRNNM